MKGNKKKLENNKNNKCVKIKRREEIICNELEE
jgi:hypothetical protein